MYLMFLVSSFPKLCYFLASVESNSTPCMLQIRLIGGNTVKVQFHASDVLAKVCEYLISKNLGDEYKEGIAITVNNFPKRIRFEGDSILVTTLQQVCSKNLYLSYRPILFQMAQS